MSKRSDQWPLLLSRKARLRCGISRNYPALLLLLLDELELLHRGLDSLFGAVAQRHNWQTALLSAQP